MVFPSPSMAVTLTATISLYLAIIVRSQTAAQTMVDIGVSPEDTSSKASEDLITRYNAEQLDPPDADSAGSSGGSRMSEEEFQDFLVSATSHSSEFVEKLVGPCHDADKNCSWKSECPGIEEIFAQYGQNGYLESDGFLLALPVALNTLTAPECRRGAEEHVFHGKIKRKPTTAETWGCGIGFVTVVLIISNIGAFLGPVMNKQFFKRLLQFLVAMGAGSLATTGLLVLIPEAFDIMSVEELGDDYVWKATVAIFSIYVFYGSERLLKTFLYVRKDEKDKFSMSVSSPSKTNEDDSLVIDPLTPVNGSKKKVISSEEGHGHSHGPVDGAEARKTLAWMVMAGDVIHNFVDGLSIGAAFTEDIPLGISISLAIICEELPHELADIAILLHSGLSIKRAVFINFLSACVCFLGLILGILLGTMISEASKWIFAMAGGLFLYVPLVDMLPDMSNHLDSLLIRGRSEARVVAFIHLLGLVIGALIIIGVVNLSAYIVVE